MTEQLPDASEAAAFHALRLLTDDPGERLAERLALAGHLARCAGLTHAALDAQQLDEDDGHHALTLGHHALDAPPTPRVRVALALAAEYGDALRSIPERRARDLARERLAELTLTATA